MANLPNKPFVFNYNARDYNPATFTIPKTSGQTMDRDMVWSATTSTVRDNISFNDDHLTIPASAFSTFNFSTTGENPMNVTDSSPSLTVVMKVRITGAGGGDGVKPMDGTDSYNILSNRSYTEGYNYMYRLNNKAWIICGGAGYDASPNSVPVATASTVTLLLRINNKQVDIKNLTTGVSNTPFTPTFNSPTKLFTIFASFFGTNNTFREYTTGDFYWAYASREVLTDEEIQQVVRYNDSKFGPNTTGSTIAASGGTLTTNLESETGWTATTASPWITVVPVSGESGTTVSFTVQKTLSQRTGVVTFTSDGGDTAEYTITQKGMEGIVPINKVYKGTRRLN